ncbi:MAG: Type pilus biosis and competence protein PilQ precursor, partial [Pseudomonadota bacterium]
MNALGVGLLSRRIFVLTFLVCIGSAQAVSPDAEEKLKWTFQNIEIKALLQSLAEIGKHNLIVAEGVTGPVSLHLKDMTWREALEVVVQSKGLVATHREGVLWITAKSETSESLQALAIPLKYAKALDVAQRLQASSSAGAGNAGHRWLSARGTVMAEPRTNQLFFLDTPAYLKQIQDVVKWLD